MLYVDLLKRTPTNLIFFRKVCWNLSRKCGNFYLNIVSGFYILYVTKLTTQFLMEHQKSVFIFQYNLLLFKNNLLRSYNL